MASNSLQKKVFGLERKNEIVDQAIAAMGIDPSMHTDPYIISEILAEMHLDNFRTNFPPMRHFLHLAKTEPQPLHPLFHDIKTALVRKHPAVIEFVELALEKEWFNSSPHIIYSAHVAYVLEALTKYMCESHEFLVELHDYLRVKEREAGLDKQKLITGFVKLYRLFHKPFFSFKAASLDPSMAFFRMRRGFPGNSIGKKKLHELYERNKINIIEYRAMRHVPKERLLPALDLFEINIYEAGIAEYEAGFKSNSICAYELSDYIERVKPEAKFIDGFPTINFSQGWDSLYTTWNMAFTLGYVDELDLVFPKLVIPSLLNAENHIFISARCISLWLIMNFDYFRKVDGKKSVSGPRNKKMMAEAWGRINKKYAIELAERETHEDSKELMRHYRQTFAHPFVKFLKLILDF